MKTIGNLIWLVCGGLIAAVMYVVGGLSLCLTIIGIPFGFQCFKLASLMLWPFGREIQETPHAGGFLSFILNVLWIVTGGIWVALNHLVWAILLGITIIGIPFAKQHLKLLAISLMPFGKVIR